MCWKQKPENCHSISAKDEIFFPKERVWQSCRLFWWMYENVEKEIFFEKSTFQRNFLRTRRKLFWLFNRSRKKFAESRNLIYEKVKLTTTIFSFRFFYGHVEGFFDNTWRRFAEFLEENQCFSKKLAFTKVFIWPSTLEIWQHCWNYFAKSRSIFAQCPKRIKKITIFFFFKAKTSFIELFLWTRRIELRKTCWFSFAHQSRMMKKVSFFWKIQFPTKFPKG